MSGVLVSLHWRLLWQEVLQNLTNNLLAGEPVRVHTVDELAGLGLRCHNIMCLRDFLHGMPSNRWKEKSLTNGGPHTTASSRRLMSNAFEYASPAFP